MVEDADTAENAMMELRALGFRISRSTISARAIRR
jgi:hypothetical protein